MIKISEDAVVKMFRHVLEARMSANFDGRFCDDDPSASDYYHGRQGDKRQKWIQDLIGELLENGGTQKQVGVYLTPKIDSKLLSLEE